MAQVWIGTSGFNYKHWAGTFYPSGLPASAWLRHYAQRFDTVELNVTFYRLPQPSAFRSWSKNTGPEFRFTIKGSRYVTHIKRLKDPDEPIQRLLGASKPLEHKRSCVLWQLPPQMRLDEERLRVFLEAIDANQAARRVRHAFEFRHESWFVPAVYRLLESANHALVHGDMAFEVVAPSWRHLTGKRRIDASPTADWWYLRRHGPHGVHTPYLDAQVEQDAAWLGAALDEGRDAYVYYNNDVNTHAPRDAQRLRAALAGKETGGGAAPETARRAQARRRRT